MIKTIKYRELEMDVASNYLDKGKMMLPDNCEGEVENVYKLYAYRNPHDVTDEMVIIRMFEEFKKRKIAVKELRFRNLKHTGTKMTDFNAKTVKEESD